MRRIATLAALALTAYAPLAAAVEKNAPAPVPKGAYEIDKSHTSLVFRVSHIGFSMLHGPLHAGGRPARFRSVPHRGIAHRA